MVWDPRLSPAKQRQRRRKKFVSTSWIYWPMIYELFLTWIIDETIFPVLCERAPGCTKRYRDHNAYLDHLKNEHGLYRDRIVVKRAMESNPAYPRGPHEPHDSEPGPSNWQDK
jgi:hypothetical protein